MREKMNKNPSKTTIKHQQQINELWISKVVCCMYQLHVHVTCMMYVYSIFSEIYTCILAKELFNYATS
jgi:hypothetical protein